MEEKKFIKNRKDQKISVLVDVSPHQKGLAIVMHGLGGFKEQPHIRVFADSFKEDGFTVIRFDATNTLGSGESYGKYDDATATNYYEDLDDVMTWAKKQPWYQEPFWLAGHSLGGMSIILFAACPSHSSGILDLGRFPDRTLLKVWIIFSLSVLTIKLVP